MDKKMIRVRTIVVLLIALCPLLLAATCGKVDPASGGMADGAMTNAKDNARNEKACKVKGLSAAPYTMSMSPGDIAEIEGRLKTGELIFARYDCDSGVTLIDTCLPTKDAEMLQARYTPFFSGTLLEQTKRFSGEDEIKGNFSNLYGSLSAEARQKASLAMDVRLLGSMNTTVNRVYRGALSKRGCEQATHFIKSVEFGAFRLNSDTSQSLKAELKVTGMGGAGTNLSRERSQGLAAGNWKACKDQKDPKLAYELGCAVPIQINLAPLRDGDPPGGLPSTTPPVVSNPNCAEGQVFADGKCVSAKKAKGGYICDSSAGDEAAVKECQKQCDLGNKPSCRLAAAIYADATKPELFNAQRSADMLQRACSKLQSTPDAPACTMLGTLYRDGEAPFGKAMPANAVKIFERACHPESSDDKPAIGDARGCYELGKMYLKGVGVKSPNPSDARDKARTEFEASCSLGYADGCARIGFVDYMSYLDNPDRFNREYRTQLAAFNAEITSACTQIQRDIEAEKAAAAERAAERDAAKPADPPAEGGDKASVDEKPSVDDPLPAEGGDKPAEPAKEEPPVEAVAEESEQILPDRCKAIVNAGDEDSRNIAAVRSAKRQTAFESKILQPLKQACYGGSSEGCNYLGMVYERGQGLDAARMEKATVYYRWSCDLDNPKACLRYGELYRQGVGFEAQPSIPDALEKYRQACFKGEPSWNAQTDSFNLPTDPEVLDIMLAQLNKQFFGIEEEIEAPIEEEAAPEGEEGAEGAEGAEGGEEVAQAAPVQMPAEVESLRDSIRHPAACGTLGQIYQQEQVEGVSAEVQRSRAELLLLSSCLTGSATACGQIGRLYLQKSSITAQSERFKEEPWEFLSQDVETFVTTLFGAIENDKNFNMSLEVFSLACEELEDSQACYSVAMDVFGPLIEMIEFYGNNADVEDDMQEQLGMLVQSLKDSRYEFLGNACDSNNPRACLDQIIYKYGSRDEDLFPDPTSTMLKAVDADTEEEKAALLPSRDELRNIQRLCAETGYTQACLDVGVLYFFFSEALVKNLKKTRQDAAKRDIIEYVIPSLEAGCSHLADPPDRNWYDPDKRQLDALLSCIVLGIYMNEGIGTAPKPDDAFRVFRFTCREHASPLGCSSVAELYMGGGGRAGVKRDPIRAYRYLDIACRNDRNYRDAFNQSASDEACSEMQTLSFEYKQKTCDQKQGEPRQKVDACTEVANKYRDQFFERYGRAYFEPKAKDDKALAAKAAKYSRRACDLGDPLSCLYTAYTPIRAARTSKKAAALAVKDLTHACKPFDSRDRILSKVWRDYGGKPGDTGLWEACASLGKVYFYGTLAKATGAKPLINRDMNLALIYLSRGCHEDNSNTNGCTELGMIHEYGLAGASDTDLSLELYEKACSRGEQEGCYRLGSLQAQYLEYDDALSNYDKACKAGVRKSCRNARQLRRQLGRTKDKDSE